MRLDYYWFSQWPRPRNSRMWKGRKFSSKKKSGFRANKPKIKMTPPRPIKIGMVPKISAKIPAKRTGKSETADIATARTAKTFPLSSLGVFSCKTVWEGIRIETKAKPSRKDPAARILESEGW